MFELLLVAIALVGSFACGIYDLKTSNVPDSVCILMIASALLIHSVYGFYTGDFTNLIDSFLFGGLFLAFGLLMYFTGQWGGGDGELLVAMGFLLPNISFVNTLFPFALSFFINTFFIGAAYSIIYSLVLVYKNPKIGKDFWGKVANKRTVIPIAVLIIASLCLALVIVLPGVFFIPLILIATLIFVWIFIL